MEASSDLWKAESVFYPPAIREIASTSSEAMSAPQEAEAAQSEAAQLEAAQIIVTPSESTEGGEFHAAKEAPKGLNLEMPQEVAPSTVSAQISCVEKPTILVQPFQAIPLIDVP